MLSHRHHHWAYIWIPAFGAFIWFGTLLSLLLTWVGTGTPHYVSQDGSIPYISDIAADFLKPLFIAGCSITAVTFVLTLVVERLLRHTGRLHPDLRRREKAFSYLAILGSVIGGIGLVLLSIFDTKRHMHAHRAFLLVFMVGVALSAIFTIIEYRWLSKEYRWAAQLRRAYIAKAIIAGVLIILAIAFAICLSQDGHFQEVGAVLEWVIAMGFTLYLLTFVYDLRMSKGMHKHELSEERLMRQRGYHP
ncbi:Frag1/DRAM/Sfk1 [Gloeopeniophorella convolvens]|nr:Frag1/DRAM/Sfk1 [Gloeopeniophorella convolvens]